MVNLKDFAKTISDETGIGRVHAYAIVDDKTTTDTMIEVVEQGGEVKCFDFATYWRARSIIGGKRSVIFSCREKLEPGIIKKITQVTETGSPIIVNSLQKLRAVKKVKKIGVNLSPHKNEPGITSIAELENMLDSLGHTVRTVSYCLNRHESVDDLKMVLNAIRGSKHLSKATIIDLGEWTFANFEEAAPYMELLREFRDAAKVNFEFRFGVVV